jgi:Clathrin light chain
MFEREEEAQFLAKLSESLSKGTTWDRIADLVDLQDSRSKTNTRAIRDTARFREVLLSLRREGETAPGAAGY